MVAQIAAHIAAPHGGRVGIRVPEGAALMAGYPARSGAVRQRTASGSGCRRCDCGGHRRRQQQPPLAHRDRQVTRVFAAAVNDMHVAHNAFTLLYLNPPFDTDAEEKRLELVFLKATCQALAVGGLLVWIIPQRVLRVESGDLSGQLVRRCASCAFPMPAASTSKVVVFGVHRGNGRSRQPDAETVAWLRQCGCLG